MRVLVDTHVLIWAVENPERLPARLVKILEGGAHEFWCSVASVWEMKLKHEAGKLPLRNSPADVARAFTLGGERVLPVGLNHVETALAVPPDTKDPFDRLLLAQCQAENMLLLTVDAKLVGHALTLPLPKAPP